MGDYRKSTLMSYTVALVLIIGAALFMFNNNGTNQAIGNAETGDLPSNITLEKAEEMMAEDADIKLIDVRTPAEYADGHLANSILLPLADVPQEYSTVLPDKEAIIILYCRSGNRAGQAQSFLQNQGYTAVINAGGINTYSGELVK